MREFETGATRDDDDNKLDFEGFFSAAVMIRYAEYLHKHRKQSDGNMRSSDNWKKGIPQPTYMKSMFRHFMEVWCIYEAGETDIQEALCALKFNVDGMLFEELRTELPEKNHTKENDCRPTVTDEVGSTWENYCTNCGVRGMVEVVRPGKAQCGSCGVSV